MMEFSTQQTNFNINILDNEQNRRIEWRFVLMTDDEVDHLIETEENAKTKNKRLVQDIVILVFNRSL